MQKTTPTDDERAIRELIETWMTSTKAGDTQTVLDLMTDDVVFMVPGQKPFGKEAFRKTAEEMKGGEASGLCFEGESDIEEIRIFDNWAYPPPAWYILQSCSGPRETKPGAFGSSLLTICMCCPFLH